MRRSARWSATAALVVHDDTSNLADLAQYAMHFCALESCGKCTPCRIGSTRGVEVIAKIRAGDTSPKQVTLLRDLCDTMVSGSLCAMGGMTPFPVLSALDHFPEDFGLAKAAVAAKRLRPDSETRVSAQAPTLPTASNMSTRTAAAAPAIARANRSISATCADPLRLHRLRHAAAPRRHRRDARNRRPIGHRAGRHLGDARGDRSRRQRAEALRDGFARTVRLVPPVPRRDRRQAAVIRRRARRPSKPA